MQAGWLWGLIIAIVLVVAAVIVPALVGLWAWDDCDSAPFGVFVGGMVAVVLLIWPALFIGTEWPPFAMKYHHWYEVTGTVTKTPTFRFLGEDGGGSTQNFLVNVSGTQIRCDDTRCSTLKIGDTVDFRCSYNWQYNSAAGWICNYVRSSEDGGQ